MFFFMPLCGIMIFFCIFAACSYRTQHFDCSITLLNCDLNRVKRANLIYIGAAHRVQTSP